MGKKLQLRWLSQDHRVKVTDKNIISRTSQESYQSEKPSPELIVEGFLVVVTNIGVLVLTNQKKKVPNYILTRFSRI